MTAKILWCTLLALSLGAVAGHAKEYTDAERQELREIYKQQCSPCHGEDGKGQTPAGKILKARNHTDPQWQKSVTDEQLIQSITNGTGNMPKWRDKLTDQQIRGLVEVVIRGLSGQ